MANYVKTFVRITPYEAFRGGYEDLKNYIESCMDEEHEGLIDEIGEVYIDPDYEPVITDDEIYLSIDSRWESPYEELIDFCQSYNVDAEFVFADEFGYDSNRYFPDLNYEIKDYDGETWLENNTCGMNAACILKQYIEEVGDDGEEYTNYHITTIAPKTAQEYELFYLVAWNTSTSINKEYYEQFDFLSIDEFDDDDYTIYCDHPKEFFNWLNNKNEE